MMVQLARANLLMERNDFQVFTDPTLFDGLGMRLNIIRWISPG